ncbi:MAG: DUF1499 domain-containing protein [Pseudomonadota bacterium]
MRVEVLATVLAVVLAGAAVLLALAPGPIYAGGVLGLLPAFSLLLDWAPGVAIAAGTAGLIACGLALYRRVWTAAAGAVASMLIGSGVWLAVDDFKSRAGANPLHDITTNIEAPPSFETIEPRSYEAGSPDAAAAYPHPDWRRQHAALYPDLAPLSLAASMADAASRARSAADALGWDVVADERGGTLTRIEATDVTGWFGFTDDIVVELRPESDERIRIDIRSVSRIGIGDVGKNAARVRDFLERMAR